MSPLALPPADLNGFPPWTLPPNRTLYRIHRREHGAWYFDTGSFGRFNLFGPFGRFNLERVAGKLGGKEGTFVLEYHGGYADGTASGPVSVVEGSGTGALAGLRGQGTAVAKKDGTTSLNLDYDYA